jgi:glycosyltransferase involved in cell wall biosynthesis
MTISVSIIIPHLNQPEFLERCLASLAPQVDMTSDVEIIVVDNGSKQLPKDICDKYPYVVLKQEKKAGPGPARNFGILVSAGNILAFIDADCVAHRDWLAKLRKEFNENKSTQVIGGDVRINYLVENRATMLEAYESVFAYRQKEYIEVKKFSGTGNLGMRRKAYDAVGEFAGIEKAEDRDWGRRCHDSGIVIKYVSEMIVYHPARQTFNELARKWDRHIDHDFNEIDPSFMGKLRWFALSIAVALSSVVDIRKVVLSTRIKTVRERFLASAMLTRIRIYRAVHMLSLIFATRKHDSAHWNR